MDKTFGCLPKDREFVAHEEVVLPEEEVIAKPEGE